MSSSETEESFSSDNLEIEVTNEIPSINDIASFFAQYPYISSPVPFLEKITQSRVLSSGNMVLAVALLSNYSEIKGFIEKRFKKTLNSLIENVTGEVAFFFCPRIINVPLQNIYELYSKVKLTHDYYIVVSRLYKVDKDEVDEVNSAFTEYSQNDLRYFPCFNEEIFLLDSEIKQNTEVKGSQSRIYVLSKKEFELFLSHFANELKE